MMVNSINPIFLLNKMPRYGKHSGYEILPSYVKTNCPSVKTIVPQQSISNRALGKLYSLFHGWPGRSQADAAAELRLAFTWKMTPQSVAHILYSEYHLLFLESWVKAPRNLIATIHEPPSRWQPKQLEQLSRLSSAIILYQRDKAFFEDKIGAGNVHFIAHGVDTQFFCPPTDKKRERKILFAGVHLRDNAMFSRVALALCKKFPFLKFELVVNKEGRDDHLSSLTNHPSINWHHEISDEALRQIYQECYLLLLPMKDSGANNSVVEAIASGLPIVTNDCGGIRDYGGENIYPLVNNGDDQAMIDLVEKYLDSPDWRSEISRKCRQFAIDNLAWPKIAEQHLKLYETLIQPPTTG